MRKRGFLSIISLITLSLFIVVGVGKANAQETKKLTLYYVDHGPGPVF
jgi:hypothetical protein